MVDLLSFDVETTENGGFVGGSLAWGPNLEDSEYHTDVRVITSTLENTTKGLIGFNSAFDLKVLRPFLKQLPLLYLDVWIAAIMLYPDKRFDAGQLTLKTLAPKLLEVPEWGSASDLINEYGSMADVPYEIISEYCRKDSVYTWCLADLFIKELRKKNLFIVAHLESQVIVPTMTMQDNGILIDRVALNGIQAKLDTDLNTLKSEMYALAPRSFSPSTPADVSSVLFDPPPTGIGMSPGNIQKTKTGFFSTAAGGLEALPPNPLKDSILQHRSISSLRNNFVASAQGSIQADGRIRASWNCLGTVTGRMIASGPDLQAVPAKSKTGKHVRRIIIAPPGYKIVAADFSQVQLRILAGMSKCKHMIEVYANDGDIHQDVQDTIPYLAQMADKDDARKLAKAVNFGLIFGMSVGGLCHYGLTYQQALEFYDAYFAKRPEVKAYHEYLVEYSKRGYVTTHFGRRIPCYPGSNAVKNLPIQGTEADIVKIGIVKITKSILILNPDVKFILQNHDELVFEVPNEKVIWFCTILRELLESIEFPVRLKVDIEAGPNWFDLEKWSG